MNNTASFDHLVDGEYFTEQHCDVNNWTYKFEDFCREYDLKGVTLVDKKIELLDSLDSTLNGGKKADPTPSDRAKLKESYENYGIQLDQAPICVTTDLKSANGGTRLHPDVLRALGVKAYCVWIVEFDSILDQIDFENKVNDPDRGIFARQNDISDVEVGVMNFIGAYKDEFNQDISEDELKAKIEEYGGNSLTKTERNNLFKKIMSQHDVDVKPARYKQWTNQTFESWMQSRDFSDTLKDEINDGSFKFYLQNTKNESRWRTHLVEMAKCAKADEPMNIIAMTPEPETDGDEDELRKEYYNDKENLCKKLDHIFTYKFKHGCYPSQHKDAVLKFAPSSHAEVKDGKLIDLGDVLERLARKELNKKED